MRFITDDDALSIRLELDAEPPEIQLDGPDQIGDRILDTAVAELVDCHQAERAPDGTRWDHLADSTIRAKGHDRIGVRTGGMLTPSRVLNGPREVEARYAQWTFPQDKPGGKEHGFHNGNARNRQPPRPLVGWTERAKQTASRLVGEALHAADLEPQWGFRPQLEELDPRD